MSKRRRVELSSLAAVLGDAEQRLERDGPADAKPPDWHALGSTDTPYGSIVSSFSFVGDPDADPVHVEYINPFSLLHYLA